MIFIGANRFANDIRNNLWKLNSWNFAGIIGIPRSGMLPATIIAEALHLGLCSFYEFFDNNGDDKVFNRHGQRPVSHKTTGTYLVIEDSCCRGSMGNYIKNLKEAFPEKTFISCAVYIDGPCNLYEPDICFVDLRKSISANYDQTKEATVLYFYNIMDGWWNFKFLYDIDGVICKNPPTDTDTEAYEAYLNNPVPLHIPISPTKNPLSFCTYRLEKYRKQTEAFLIAQNIPVKTLYMFNAETISQRNKVSSGTYKGYIYKNSDYVLFIESNDYEAQEICRVSGKPVYCTETGRMYKMNK